METCGKLLYSTVDEVNPGITQAAIGRDVLKNSYPCSTSEDWKRFVPASGAFNKILALLLFGVGLMAEAEIYNDI